MSKGTYDLISSQLRRRRPALIEQHSLPWAVPLQAIRYSTLSCRSRPFRPSQYKAPIYPYSNGYIQVSTI